MKFCRAVCLLCLLPAVCVALIPIVPPTTPYTWASILQMTANELVGLPLTLAMSVLNALCSPIVIAPEISLREPVDPANVYFQFMTPCQNYSINVLEKLELAAFLATNTQNRIIFMHIPGFQTDIDISTDIARLWHALACRSDDYLFVGMNLFNYMQTGYFSAIRNADEIADYVAETLAYLVNNHYLDLSKFILSGHSLGAHHAGMIGRKFYALTGQSLKIIIGLDPARPCFDSNYSHLALSASDADYVAIIHGNNGIAGMRTAIGSSDYYPDGAKSFPSGSNTAVEAHDLPVVVLAETLLLGNEYNFPSHFCSSFNKLLLGTCETHASNYMGLAADRSKNGIYYVPTNYAPPYGPNAVHPNWLPTSCHICEA